jgi:hypothetical protein
MHSLYLYHDTYNGFEETKWFVLDKQWVISPRPCWRSENNVKMKQGKLEYFGRF